MNFKDYEDFQQYCIKMSMNKNCKGCEITYKLCNKIWNDKMITDLGYEEKCKKQYEMLKIHYRKEKLGKLLS